MSLPEIYTPEQVEAGIPLLTAGWLREQCREGRIDHLRLQRNAVAFTVEQVESLLREFTKTGTGAVGALTTSRSRRRSA